MSTAAPDSQPLELDDELKAAIGTAFDSGNFVTVGYIGDDGFAHLSRRGSTQVYGRQQLAIWVRKREEGLAKAIEERPQLTLLHIDLSKPQVYTFYGHGQVSGDREVADRVYGKAPPAEQAQDPERRGVPLIIELERIEARGTRNFLMTRSGAP